MRLLLSGRTDTFLIDIDQGSQEDWSKVGMQPLFRMEFPSFGVAKGTKRVFLAGFSNKPLLTGTSLPMYSFPLSCVQMFKGLVVDEERTHECSLDIGIHYIVLHSGALYVQDTYLQRMIVYQLDKDEHVIIASKRIIPLFEPGVNHHYFSLSEYRSFGPVCHEYRHMNAFVPLPDGCWLVHCSYLGQGPFETPIPPKQNKPSCTLELFDFKWTHLASYPLIDQVVHDLVLTTDYTGVYIWYCGDHDVVKLRYPGFTEALRISLKAQNA